MPSPTPNGPIVQSAVGAVLILQLCRFHVTCKGRAFQLLGVTRGWVSQWKRLGHTDLLRTGRPNVPLAWSKGCALPRRRISTLPRLPLQKVLPLSASGSTKDDDTDLTARSLLSRFTSCRVPASSNETDVLERRERCTPQGPRAGRPQPRAARVCEQS